MAIAQFRSQEFDKAVVSLDRANTQIALRTTAGKFKLLCAINTDDKELANKLFGHLVDASQRESTPIATRKSYCEWLGEIIGTLDSAEAKSPIDEQELANAKKSLLGLAEKGLSSAFGDQYDIARAKADRTRQTLARFNEMGRDAAVQSNQAATMRIAKLEADLDEATMKARELSNEQEATLKSLRIQLASVRNSLSALDAEWNLVTPGMPGQMVTPIPPRRELIYVNLYQTRLISEYRNGRYYEYQIQERRPQWDIETERNSIFESQMATYSSQNSLYQQNQRDLAAWRQRDDERRRDISDRRQELENNASQVRTQIEIVNSAMKGNGGGNGDIKKEIAELKLGIKAMEEVIRAADAGKPHMVLRPTRIDPWLITEEKKRLLQTAVNLR
jgi:predicted  nucleic acid-binding Zn-ribbon protein